MWNNVTEIKWNIFGRVWLLKNLFFFKCLYFSEYDIWMLFFGWEIGHPLSTCTTGGMEGESSKMCTGAYRGRGVEKSVIRNVFTEWIAPNKFCRLFFCALFRPSALEHHRQQKNVVVFFHHNYDYFILCDN